MLNINGIEAYPNSKGSKLNGLNFLNSGIKKGIKKIRGGPPLSRKKAVMILKTDKILLT
jgi:hypothetical protein